MPESTPSPLAGISTEDLVKELLSRDDMLSAFIANGTVASVWNPADVLPVMDDDERFDELTEEQAKEVSLSHLMDISGGLQEALATRGNDYIADHLEMNVERLLSEVAGNAPKP